MRSIKVKLVFLYLALVFMVMVVSGTIMILQIQSSEIERMKSDLREIANMCKSNIIDKYSIDYFGEAIGEVYQHTDSSSNISRQVHLFILSSRGAYIESSYGGEDYLDFGNRITKAINGEEYFLTGTRFPDKNGVPKVWCEYFYPVFDEYGNQTFIIYTRSDMAAINESRDMMANTIYIASVVALILTAIVGSIVAGTFTSPILRLTKSAVAFADGELYQEIAVSSNDEIGKLTATFNYMAEELSRTIEEIEREKNKLEVLLSNMTDGVLAFDISGTLIHANKVSYDLLETEETEELSYAKLGNLLNIKLKDLSGINIDSEEDNEENKVEELAVSIGEKYLTVLISIFQNKYHLADGVIVVLQDSTRFIKLDNMRKEFVANVSHEIRTPITTIKGWAETILMIENMETADRNENLEVILFECDKITLLVEDLLELSKFDNNQFKINVSKVDLVDLTKQTAYSIRLEASRMQQKIEFETELENAYVNADSSRIIQVFTNVINNAVKYSSSEGVITITITDDKDFYVVNIRDTGEGIPKESVGMLFERFYRVDKARSRSSGGTGLGLPIAKEIMEIHQGKISITSELGVGTDVKIEFNKNFNVEEDSELNEGEALQ